jgi:lysyl oxidase/SdrD B-like protein
MWSAFQYPPVFARPARSFAKRSAAVARRHARRLFLEPLENRCLLAGVIAGTLVEDLTGNGITADDPPIADRAINLFRDDGDGVFDAGSDPLVDQQESGNTGNYDFRQLDAGTYFVQQELPLSWVQWEEEEEPHEIAVIPPHPSLPIVAERNDTIPMATATGLTSATPGTYVARGVIGDNKKVAGALDVDFFRVQLNAGDRLTVDIDTWEFGSELSAMLRVFDASGVMLLGHDGGGPAGPTGEFVAKTSGLYYIGVGAFANGLYDPFVEGSGDILVDTTGDYTVEIAVGPRPGAEPIAVTIGASEHVTGIDLAASRLGTIVGRMYDDTNGNGIQDAGEPGLDQEVLFRRHNGDAGPWTVTRSIDLDGNGAIDPATESGWYSFDDLRPGIYFTATLLSTGFSVPGRIQTSPTFDRPKPELIGEVTSGPAEPPSPGLAPDLTLDLASGLGDWFITGSILHFGQGTPNIGLGPMEIIAGADQGNGTRLVYQRIYNEPELLTYTDYEAGTVSFHPEHNHTHFDDYAEFSVLEALPDASGDGIPEVGDVVITGEKRSFCLADSDPYDLSLPNAAQEPSFFGCVDRQRISVGWMDLYDPMTPGQQIDVSGLPPGQYWLQGRVDPENHLRETNENNNVGRVLITIGLGEATAPAGARGVQLVSGEISADNDFGNFQSVTISGHVFEDHDADGIQDTKDNGLDGWVIFLDLNGDGVLNNPVEGDNVASPFADEPWAITDKHGNYRFDGVGPGEIAVRQIVPAGWRQTTVDPDLFFTASGRDVSGIDFGSVLELLGALDWMDPLSAARRRRG